MKQWEQSRRAIPEPVLALAELARDPDIRVRLEALDLSAPHLSEGLKMKATKSNAGRIAPRKGAHTAASNGTRKRVAHV